MGRQRRGAQAGPARQSADQRAVPRRQQHQDLRGDPGAAAGGRRKLGLDDSVAGHLPQFELDERITVRMLLQHTTGIYDFVGGYYDDGTPVPGIPRQDEEWVANRFKAYPPEELVRLALEEAVRAGEGLELLQRRLRAGLAAGQEGHRLPLRRGDAAADPAPSRAEGHHGAGHPGGDPRSARPRLPPVPGRLRPVEGRRRHPPEPLPGLRVWTGRPTGPDSGRAPDRAGGS